MRNVLRAAVVVTAGGLTLLPAALGAAAHHVRVRELSHRDADVSDYALAANDRGRTDVAWASFFGHAGVWVRNQHGRHWFGRAHRVGGGRDNPDRPAIAIGHHGTEAVVWTTLPFNRRPQVLAAVRDPGGSFGRPKVLSRDAGGEGVDVAIAPDGRLVAVWTRHVRGGGKRVGAAVRRPGGGWSHAENVSGPGRRAGSPHVVIDSAGDAVAVWESRPLHRHRHGDHHIQIRAATRPAGGHFGRAHVLSNPRHRSLQPLLAGNARGDVAVLWASSAPHDQRAIGYSTRASGGGFTAPRRLAAPAIYAEPTGVALAPSGGMTAVWSELHVPSHRGACFCLHVRERHRPAGGSFGRARQVTARATFGASAAADAAGRLYAVWAHDFRRHRRFHTRLSGRLVRAGGSLGRRRELLEADDLINFKAALLPDHAIVGAIASARRERLVGLRVPPGR